MIRQTVLVIAVFVSAFVTSASGQEYPDWGGFPPLYHVNDLVMHEGKVYAATEGGLFSYDPESREYRSFYKNNGLEFTDLNCIAATSDYLYFGSTENGLWRYDPLTDRFDLVSFPEYQLKTSKNPTGISVNAIFVKNDSILYVGHGNGLDRLNLQSGELRAYTNFGDFPESTPVNGITVAHDSLWVATSRGLAFADETNPNLEFPENWRTYDVIDSATLVPIPASSVIYAEDAVENAIYLGAPTAGILRFSYENDELTQKISTFKATDFIKASGKYWAVGIDGLTRKDGFSWGAWKTIEKIYLTCVTADESGELWIGSENEGLLGFSNETYEDIPPESNMLSDTFYSISLSPDGVLWAATAYRDASDQLYSVIQRYDGEAWSYYDGRERVGIQNQHTWASTGVAVLADTPERTWVASWGRVGLSVIEDDGLPDTENDQWFPADSTSTIIKPTDKPGFKVCSDLAADEQGNIWIANLQVDPPAHKIETIPTSGIVVVDDYPITKYTHYSPAEDGLPTAAYYHICLTGNNWVWGATWNKGLVGIYTGPDPYDKSDAEVHQYSLADGILATKVTALASDSHGNLLVGTEAGLNLLTWVAGNRYEISDLNDALDEDHRDIRSITVDDSDNRWIGTTKGLVKLDPQNSLEATYTIDNSGLFSDTILSLLYDTGRDLLWVGTSFGINSFDVNMNTKNATAASIHIYPNPFELWGYDSQVMFTNLEAGSPVEIYSFDGVHVNTVTAKHDEVEAEWDGRNFRDAYVGSGVYFIIGTDGAGQKFRDKLIVMRR